MRVLLDTNILVSYLLAYALIRGGDFLVSGDKDWLVLKKISKVKIVNVKEFAKKLEVWEL